MRTNEKREAALKLLATTGIWPSNYAPPLVRFLWRIGFDVPPPHLGMFWTNALVTGLYFAVGSGLIMWIFVWSIGSIPVAIALSCAVGAGATFGLAMAGYYAYGRRKYHLPLWKEFNSDR